MRSHLQELGIDRRIAVKWLQGHRAVQTLGTATPTRLGKFDPLPSIVLASEKNIRGCPLLEMKMIDPRLEDNYVAKEVECMMVAASLCISPHPEKRPRMSKVLKILEGDVPGDHMANRNGHHISFYQKQESKKVYGADKPLNETIVHSPSSHLMRLKHHMKFSPSRVRPPKYNDWNGSFKPMTPSDKRNEILLLRQSILLEGCPSSILLLALWFENHPCTQMKKVAGRGHPFVSMPPLGVP
ncbi:hypothetical protein CK203_101164 [Vitis vinifera]|uniref:non-specific serine/threonine protein kinase n=1 Tax=Vitis vinifera TaxID=29760 RepID=A0A438EDN5_VITVI|nr:hypothetical protein CK203_101164 [Vitis vinifera]